MLEAINETISFIRRQTKLQPETAIILGTGLGKIADEIQAEQIIPYEKIPHFPVSTVEGHDGKLITGTYAGKDVIVLKGRFHFY
jgi:purine-nucleoside phosphorylase